MARLASLPGRARQVHRTRKPVTCSRCGWVWVPYGRNRPARCAHPTCRSPYWQTPRTQTQRRRQGFPLAAVPPDLLMQPPQDRKAALLTRLRQMKAAGMTLQPMADTLNGEGVPTPSGRGHWTKGTIGRLLAQDAQEGQA